MTYINGIKDNCAGSRRETSTSSNTCKCVRSANTEFTQMWMKSETPILLDSMGLSLEQGSNGWPKGGAEQYPQPRGYGRKLVGKCG